MDPAQTIRTLHPQNIFCAHYLRRTLLTSLVFSLLSTFLFIVTSFLLKQGITPEVQKNAWTE